MHLHLETSNALVVAVDINAALLTSRPRAYHTLQGRHADSQGTPS